MTEELKQAAQAALEALEEIALAGMSGTGQESEEGLRDWHARQAWKFIGIAARELEPLRRALTQRPAAQTEREAFEAWARPNGYDLRTNAILGHYSSIDTLRAWNGWQARASLPAPQQATPAPVGEPFGYFRALPFGWEQCGEHDDGAVALYDHPAPGVPEDVQRETAAAQAKGADK